MKNRHITRKEAIIAIQGIESLMDSSELDNIKVIILVDNIAAASVVNKGVCIFEKLTKP